MDCLQSLNDLFAAVDNVFAEVENQFGAEVRCGRGCNDCCHAVFDVSLIEAVSLAGCLVTFNADERQQSINAAREAARLWEEIVRNQTDLATARIRCPLLSAEGRCLCYDNRPVNCRTYGVPTVIGGAGHVCGYSGFEPGRQYPTVNLEQLQKILFDLSVQFGGEEMGRQRWPVAEVLLHQENFTSIDRKNG